MPRSRWARRSARGIEKKVCVKAVFFYKKDRPTDDPLGCLRQPHGTHPPFPSPFRQPRFLFYAPGGQFFSNFLMPTLGVAGVPTPCSHPAVHYAPACFARAMQLQHGASLRSVCPFKTMGSSFKLWFPYFRRRPCTSTVLTSGHIPWARFAHVMQCQCSLASLGAAFCG